MRVNGRVTLCSGFANLLHFVLFQPSHAFGGQQVGPGSRHCSRPDASMKIRQQLPLGSFTTNSFVKVHYLLVVALHEVYFQSFHAPLRELLERGCKLII